MRLRIFTILTMIISITSQVYSSIYPDQPFTKLSIIDTKGEKIFTAGSCNTAMVSEDYGASWQYFNSPINYTLGIKIVPESNGQKAFYLSRQNIYILDSKTQEFEDLTSVELSEMHDNFRAVFTVMNKVYLIDDNGIFRAEIGDYSWEKTSDFALGDEFVTKVDISESYIWIGTSKGKIYKTDLETNEVHLAGDLGGRIYHMEMANDDIGYFVFQGGSDLIKTTDGAESFFPLPGMPESISPVAIGEDIVMTINTNRIYVSTDGGQSSTRYSLPYDGMTSLISGYTMKADGTLYLVGDAGMVLKTDDLCQSFQHLNPYMRENLTNISFNKNGEGYAIGGAQNILHTTDGGENWTFTDWGQNESGSLRDVLAVGSDRFLIAINSGIIIVENNSPVDTIVEPTYSLHHASNGEDIYAIRRTDEYVLSKSSDQGSTWANISSLDNSPNFLVQSPNGNLYTHASNGKMIMSNDEGMTWEPLPLEGLDGNVFKVTFYNDDLALISTGNYLYRTSDRGQSAQQIANIYGIDNIYMFSDKHYLYTNATNDQTTIWETTNGGLSWQSTGSSCALSYDSFFDGVETIWLAQKGGHINKHIKLETTGTQQAKPLETKQLYPNPVFQGQDLTFDLSTNGSSEISIYDMNGSKLYQTKTRDTFIRMSTTRYLPGTYIYSITAENGSRFVGRFIVLD